MLCKTRVISSTSKRKKMRDPPEVTPTVIMKCKITHAGGEDTILPREQDACEDLIELEYGFEEGSHWAPA